MSLMRKTVIVFFPLLRQGVLVSNFPWALLYLERVVRHLDIDLLLLDERLNPDYSDIIRKVKDNLLFAGVSSLLGFQIAGAIEFSKAIKSITDAPVIWGGWVPTVFPELVLKESFVDYICVGQGEIPFRSFTERMLKGEKISDIPGIGYKINGEIFVNAHEKLMNPDTFPKINLSLLDIEPFIDINGKVEYGYRYMDYLASTGCPNSCSFCNVVHFFDHRWFDKKIPEIISDLRFLQEKAAITHFTFSEDNFFANKKFVMNFCNEIIKSGLSFTWDAMLMWAIF